MSTEVVTKKEPGMGTLVLVLCVISAATALVLALVNMITAPVIAQNTQDKNDAAMAAVLPASAYTELAYAGSDATIDALYEAEGAGYVVQVSPDGSFSGTLTIMVGIDSAGTVTGVEITATAETSGLGANASKDSFKGQFTGASGETAVTKDGGAIESITGATITSRSVSNGVNSALTAVASLG